MHRRGAILVPGATRVVIFGWRAPNRSWAIMRGGARHAATHALRAAMRALPVAAETSASGAPHASHAPRLHARASARDSLTARRHYPSFRPSFFPGGAMTKSQLVAKLADAGGVTRKQADDLIAVLTDTIVKTVKRGESVKIPGLGNFRLRKMKARMGRNPQTGEAIKIPARKKVGFSVAKTFKETVLGKSK